MGLRDIINRMPGTKRELSDYIMDHYSNVRETVASNPNYRVTLERAIEESFDKYHSYLSNALGNVAGKLSGAGHVVGYAADAWLLGTGDIIGSLGGKFLHLLAQIPEKAYGLVYGLFTGNYLDSLQNIFEGVLSYIPGLTFVDQGLERIIKKRMVKDAVARFEGMLGASKPWTAGLYEKLSDKYTGVRDRAANVFTPGYQPAFQGD